MSRVIVDRLAPAGAASPSPGAAATGGGDCGAAATVDTRKRKAPGAAVVRDVRATRKRRGRQEDMMRQLRVREGRNNITNREVVRLILSVY